MSDDAYMWGIDWLSHKYMSDSNVWQPSQEDDKESWMVHIALHGAARSQKGVGLCITKQHSTICQRLYVVVDVTVYLVAMHHAFVLYIYFYTVM